MGYLDKTSVTVDATLTHTGRTKLAAGEGINIKYFVASDRGIDYSLYDPNHANGSAYYDEAILNLPNIEATPQATHYLTDKLVTFDRHATQIPTISDVAVLYDFGALISTKEIIPKIYPTNSGGDFTLTISNPHLLNVTGNNSLVHDYDKTLNIHLGVQKMDSPASYRGSNFIISPKYVTENTRVHLLIQHLATGIYQTSVATMTENSSVQTKIKNL